MSRKLDKRNLDTKHKLAYSFKSLVSNSSVEQITVLDITKNCNLNRNTFYYHFSDINELIEWIFKVEIDELLNNVDIKDTRKLLETIFSYAEDNRNFINSVYIYFGRDTLRIITYPYFYNTLNELIIEKNLDSTFINHDYKDFVINFYSEGISSSLINFIQNKYIDKDKIINYLLLLNDTINNIITIED